MLLFSLGDGSLYLKLTLTLNTSQRHFLHVQVDSDRVAAAKTQRARGLQVEVLQPSMDNLRRLFFFFFFNHF